jgi:hypothetical protein
MAPLPRWVVSNGESVRREVLPYLAMSDAERLRHLAAACRAGAGLLALRGDRERALAHRDPLSEDTLRALSRLRARVGAARGRAG